MQPSYTTREAGSGERYCDRRRPNFAWSRKLHVLKLRERGDWMCEDHELRVELPAS